MTQDISRAGRSGGAGTPAIARSGRQQLSRLSTKCHKAPRKAPKKRGSYLPEPKVLRIQQRYIAGQNKSEIAREEKCDRETVARIVKFPEVQEFIASQQQEFFGLIPDAMAAVRYALQVEKDSMVAFRVLQATGVAPQKGERLQLPDSTPQSGYQRQVEIIANLLLEGNKNFGISLSERAEQALAGSSEKCEGAKISPTTLASPVAPRGTP